MIFYRLILPPPGWGDWRFMNHPDPWSGQLQIFQDLSIQVAQQTSVVDLKEFAVHCTQVKLDDLFDQRDAEIAAFKDETSLLLSLKADLDFHTKRLRDASAYPF